MLDLLPFSKVVYLSDIPSAGFYYFVTLAASRGRLAIYQESDYLNCFIS
jgi:hypothetical protein